MSDIARGTGFNVSTAFRQLQTLVARGYVEQDLGHLTYVLGPRFYQLASGYLKGKDLASMLGRTSRLCGTSSARPLTW